jgi:hypothetical protein
MPRRNIRAALGVGARFAWAAAWRAACRGRRGVDRTRLRGTRPAPDLVMTNHVAVWIDHKEARIFHIQPDKIDAETVLAPQHLHHRHPKGPEGPKEHPDDAKRFFHALGRSLEGTEEILLVGPSTAKLDYVRYLHQHDQAIEHRVIGIETVDHPSDGQLVAYARTYFAKRDRAQ